MKWGYRSYWKTGKVSAGRQLYRTILYNPDATPGETCKIWLNFFASRPIMALHAICRAEDPEVYRNQVVN